MIMRKQIKAAVFHAAHDIRIETVPEPIPKDNEVLVNVAWGGICGTDLHEYLLGPLAIPKAGHPHSLTGGQAPVTLGHEFCGHVRGVPPGTKDANGTELKDGMPVMVDPRLNCANCEPCASGSSNVCSKWGFLGLSGGGGGGFSDTAAVRADMLYSLPPDMRLDHAVLIEPLAVARHALTVSGVPTNGWKDLSVLVVGGGPVGFATLCNLHAAGCKDVFVSEPTAQRQQQCQGWAKAIFNPLTQTVPDECRAATKDNLGVDIVFDCAGIDAGMRDGFAALRPKGTFVNVAGWETPFQIPFGEFMGKELTIKATLAYDERDFGDVVRDFVAGKFEGAESMVSARIGLEELVERGFEELVRNKERYSKILVTPRREFLEAIES